MPEHSFVAHRHRQGGFLEGLIADLLALLEHAHRAERLAGSPGLMQAFDPRVRLFGVLVLIGLTVQTHHLSTVLGLFTLMLAMAMLSRIPLGLLARGIWISVLFFTGLLALPALFLVPGETIARLPLLGWTLSAPGLASAAMLIARALTTSSLAALLILTTPWPHLLKALRILGMPAVAIVILGMTYRYLFLLLNSALDLFTARRSRQVGRLDADQSRRLLVAGGGVLLGKSLQLANDVYLAMLSRGYRGEHQTLDDFAMRHRDWAALLGMLVAVAIALAIRI